MLGFALPERTATHFGLRRSWCERKAGLRSRPGFPGQTWGCLRIEVPQTWYWSFRLPFKPTQQKGTFNQRHAHIVQCHGHFGPGAILFTKREKATQKKKTEMTPNKKATWQHPGYLSPFLAFALFVFSATTGNPSVRARTSVAESELTLRLKLSSGLFWEAVIWGAASLAVRSVNPKSRILFPCFS